MAFSTEGELISRRRNNFLCGLVVTGHGIIILN